jgi:hypothetical protein
MQELLNKSRLISSTFIQNICIMTLIRILPFLFLKIARRNWIWSTCKIGWLLLGLNRKLRVQVNVWSPCKTLLDQLCWILLRNLFGFDLISLWLRLSFFLLGYRWSWRLDWNWWFCLVDLLGLLLLWPVRIYSLKSV